MNNNYLIYGEDLFLIKENIKKIINTSKINEDSIIKYNMEENTIETLVEELNMYDMFGNKKIVMSDNSIFLSSEVKKDNNYNADLLLEYLKNPNPESILIIILNKNIDERKKISKELKKLCTVINCNKLNDYDLFDYIKNRLIKNGFKVNNSSIDLIIKYIGNDLMNLNNELSKLMMYKLQERTITDSDVKSIISKNIHNNVFDLVDSVVSNNKVKIFEIYEDLMKNSNEEPTKIIVMLANQFRLILQTKLLINDGMNEGDIAKKLGIHPYRIKLANEKSKTIDTNKLTKYLVDLANLDIDIKSGKVNKNIGLELFFLNM